MNKRQEQILQSLRSAQAFIDTNSDALPPTVIQGTKAKLDRTIASLTNHATNQTGDHLLGMGLTRTKRSLRKTLIKKHMKPIARIARAELPATVCSFCRLASQRCRPIPSAQDGGRRLGAGS